MSGRVVHFEIPYDDGDRARTFYADVFGWDVTEMPDMGYTMVSTGPTGERGPTEAGYIGGGMMQRSDPNNAPNLVIDVPSIDEALAKIEANGGTTISGRDPVGDMGFSAYFRDSEGNLMGLWETTPGA